MIASFSKNFIFIKTRKTGGTSAEMVLSTWCAPGDACSTLMNADESARIAMSGLPGQRDYLGQKIWNHMPAYEVRRTFPSLDRSLQIHNRASPL